MATAPEVTVTVRRNTAPSSIPEHNRESHGPCCCATSPHFPCTFCKLAAECPICHPEREQLKASLAGDGPESVEEMGREGQREFTESLMAELREADERAAARRRREARAELGFSGVDRPYTTACEEALQIVYGRGEAGYGHPYDDYLRTSRMVEAYLGLPPGFIGARKMAGVMAIVKLSRDAFKSKRDNRVDLAGYAECMQRIADREDDLAKAYAETVKL